MSDELYEAIRRRRVTRNMTAEPVSAEDVARIVLSARYAPNAGNRRLQSVVSVRDPDMVRMLRMVSPGMVPRPQAAAVICIDGAGAARYGISPDARGLYIDVGTAAATMLLAAEAVGLGACPVTSFSVVAVRTLLGLEASMRPSMIICLGYPSSAQPPPMP